MMHNAARNDQTKLIRAKRHLVRIQHDVVNVRGGLMYIRPRPRHIQRTVGEISNDDPLESQLGQ